MHAGSAARPPGAGGPATLVVAGVSVRTLAESARLAGWRVTALDLFGDRDTRRASQRWRPIGSAETLAIEPRPLFAALRAAAAEPGVMGWVAGSGFEAAPQWLQEGAALLPLLGMAGEAVAALRDARHFFATLDRLGLAHPVVAFAPPADPAGWLLKQSGGSGGWHIRHAAHGAGHAPAAAPADAYWQRLQCGTPMSALFLADGRSARVLALNRLLVRPLQGHPMVYCGAVGPIADAALQQRVQHALDALVPAFALRGLASLDFIHADGGPWLLEINPRPSASMQLHEHTVAGGLLQAHVRACAGALPAAGRPTEGVRGHRIVFAAQACEAGAALVEALDRDAECHDVPAAPGGFERGQPVCSVSAQAHSAEAVEALLDQRRAQVLARLQLRTGAHQERVS